MKPPMQSSQANLNDAQNSIVSEPEASRSAQALRVSNSAQPSERARKNLELLKTILEDYSREELENEIFILHEVASDMKKKSGGGAGKNQSRKAHGPAALGRATSQQ